MCSSDLGGTLYGNWGKASANNTGGITIPGMFIQSGATSGTPTAIANGDLWWNTDTGKLNIWWTTANAWVVATPTPDMSQYYPVGGGNINGNASVSGLLTATGNITATSGGSNPMTIGIHPNYPAYSALWRQGQDYSILADTGNTYLNAPSGSGVIYFRTGNTTRGYVDSSGNILATGVLYAGNTTSYYINGAAQSYLWGLTLAGNSYFRPQSWIQFDSSYGVFWPNTNGAHLHGNDLSTYTQIALRGSRNSYGGIYDQFSGVNGFMYDGSGNGGVYREGTGRWYLYHYVGNNCLGIGTSNTDATYSIYTDSKGARLGGYTQVVGTIDAEQFRDRNDTTYYADFNSTSDAAIRVRGGAVFGPNTTWSKYLMVGGDGRQNYIDNTSYASVATTNGNLHLDAASGMDTFINWYDGAQFKVGAGDSSNTRLLINSSGNVGIATIDLTSWPYSDNSSVVGGISYNRVWVNGSIQLVNDSDAIVIGRNTSSFFRDEELGFGWGGGWYMNDGSWIRARNNKAIITSNEIRGTSFVDTADTGYYLDANSTSVLWRPDYSTQQRWNIHFRAVDAGAQRPSQTGNSDYWTTTVGWGTNYGTWSTYWKYEIGRAHV